MRSAFLTSHSKATGWIRRIEFQQTNVDALNRAQNPPKPFPSRVSTFDHSSQASPKALKLNQACRKRLRASRSTAALAFVKLFSPKTEEKTGARRNSEKIWANTPSANGRSRSLQPNPANIPSK